MGPHGALAPAESRLAVEEVSPSLRIMTPLMCTTFKKILELSLQVTSCDTDLSPYFSRGDDDTVNPSSSLCQTPPQPDLTTGYNYI